MPTVADCERVQTAWFRLRSETLDTGPWSSDGLTWLPDGEHLWLMFPRTLPARALAAGVEHACERGRYIGVWLSLDLDPAPLAAAGFERGWAPWWMVADLRDVAGPADPRVQLQRDTADYVGEHAAYRRELALARLDPPLAWYAAAYRERRFAGRAWSFLTGDLAGVFDMAVWPPFRRRGLGTGLLRAVCAAAAGAGARHAVLNATPEGKQLYETCGFRQVGEGITWWRSASQHAAPVRE